MRLLIFRLGPSRNGYRFSAKRSGADRDRRRLPVKAFFWIDPNRLSGRQIRIERGRQLRRPLGGWQFPARFLREIVVVVDRVAE